MSTICGIDASSSCTGISIFISGNLVYYDKIKPKKRVNFRDNTCQIVEQVLEIVERYKPDIIYMEDVPAYVNRNGVKPLISLGCVQGVFYHELTYKKGFNIKYIPVSEWRQKLDLLKGERNRDKQKLKSVQLCNSIFGLDLQYVEGKSLATNDDDIAEAILVAYSQMI